MSERPPAGRDAQGPEPSPAAPTAEEVLAAHLQRRGARQAPRTLAASIVARVGETVPQRRWRLTLAIWRPRLAVAASGLTLALLAGLLFFSPPAPRTSTAEGSPTAPVSPTASASGLTWDPAQRPLTPPELRRVLGAGVPPGTVLIVDDQIVPRAPCVSAVGCAIGELANGMDFLVQPPAGGHLPFVNDPAAFSTSIKGPLALQVGAGSSLVFLGSVASNGLRMAFKAHDLAARSATGGLFVIPAWLSAAGAYPCASMTTTPPPVPTSELGLPGPKLEPCAPNFLTDTDPPLPLTGVPDDRFDVQGDAYARFAIGGGAAARQGIYLVRDWPGYGEILARLTPMPIPSNDATALTIAPPATASTIVMSADELVGRVMNGSLAPGSIAVAAIPASAVSILSPSAAGTPDDPGRSRWIITVGSRFVRVDGAAGSAIVGVQAFLIQEGGSVRALGPAATGAAGAPLDGAAVGDGLSVVQGWLRAGPPRRCPATPPSPRIVPRETGIFASPLTWTSCRGMWILPSADDPWIPAPATDGSGSTGAYDPAMPAGTLHVQDGAASMAGEGPVEGIWLVRAATTSRCRPGSFCPLQLDPQPPPGVTWYELVGPVAAPNATLAGPSASTLTVVLSQDRLVAEVASGAFPAGSIVIARATIAPVILSSFPPEQGAIVGKVGSISVHWGSDSGIGASEPRPIALRIRPDGGLDYLGPATLDKGDQPFAGSGRPVALGLLLVHGWFYRPTVNLRCPEPVASGTPRAFKAFDGQKQDLECDPAWILPSAEDPLKVVGGSQILDIPNGGLPVQIRDAPPGAPAEGLFLVRYVACEWSGGLDVCHVPAHYTWEFVGPVFVPGP